MIKLCMCELSSDLFSYLQTSSLKVEHQKNIQSLFVAKSHIQRANYKTGVAAIRYHMT